MLSQQEDANLSAEEGTRNTKGKKRPKYKNTSDNISEVEEEEEEEGDIQEEEQDDEEDENDEEEIAVYSLMLISLFLSLLA